MTKTHICTTSSLRAGVDIPPMKCPYCAQYTLIATWVDSQCVTCNFNTEQYRGRNHMNIREKMGFTRKQFSKLIGYAPSTIKKYEWTNPSKVYTGKFRKFVFNYFKDSEVMND